MNTKLIKLASEKCLNKFSFPIISIKGKPILKYPILVGWDTVGFICHKGKFGPKEMMVLDILGTYIIHKLCNNFGNELPDFSKRIPTSKDSKVKDNSNQFISYKLLRYLTERLSPYDNGIIQEGYYHDDCRIYLDGEANNTRIKKPQTIKFTDTYLKKQLPFLKKYSSKRLFEMVTSTSKIQVQMNYPIRFFDGNNFQNYPYANLNCASRFFTLVNVDESNISKNGNVLEREYIIRFDTFLGYFFIQNCISSYVDLLPGHFYQMSDYTQLFYRMLILPYFNKAKNPISLDEIKHRLVLKSENFMVRKTVNRILGELEGNSFIKNHNEIILDNSYWYIYEKNPWKTVIEGS